MSVRFRSTALVLVLVGAVAHVVPAGAVSQLAGARALEPAVSAGGDHSCVSMTDGTLECWGRNLFGQPGTGTLTTPSPPLAVPGPRVVGRFAGGGALTSRAWGTGRASGGACA